VFKVEVPRIHNNGLKIPHVPEHFCLDPLLRWRFRLEALVLVVAAPTPLLHISDAILGKGAAVPPGEMFVNTVVVE
jgi:hypothetical protein